MRLWPGHSLCAYCKVPHEQRPRATIRLFTGVTMHGGGALGGGYPACDAHAGEAIAAAFQNLNSGAAPAGWEVTAYRITVGYDDWPRMAAKPLWTARAPS